MNNKENTFVRELKKIYEIGGYTLKEVNGGNLSELYFKKSKKANMLIKVTDSYGDIDKIRNTLRYFESIESECKQFKVIFLQGFDKKASDLFKDFNMVIDDNSVIDKMTLSLNNHGEIVELFNYNVQAIKESLVYLKKYKKVSINNATGLGKTIIVKEIIKTKDLKKILYLAPSDEILSQSKKALSSVNNIEYKTFAKIYYNKKMCYEKYDFIIIDEYHRTGALKWESAIKTLIENNKEAYLVGLTATYIRYLDNKRDMREELFQDKYISEITINEALVRNILPSPTYISSIYSINYEKTSAIKRVEDSDISNQEKAKITNDIKNRCLEWEDNIRISNLINKYASGNKSKFIVFCKNINHMNDVEDLVVSWFDKNFDKKVNVLKIFTGVRKRKTILDEFNKSPNDKITLLFAIDILNEGVHLDGVSGLFFLRETESPTVYFQQLGRALQSNNKQDIVIFDFVKNFSNLKNQKRLYTDNEAIEKLNSKRKNLKLEPIDFKFKIIDDSEEMVDFFNNVYSRISDTFKIRYEELKEYYKNNGHTTVPVKTSILGEWCSKIRTKKRKGLLSKKQIELLDELDFTWDIYEEMWMSKLHLYKEYKDKNLTLTTELKNWEHNQKKAFKAGELSDKKIKRLKDINFDFNRKSKTENLDWDGMFNLIKEYYEKNNEKPKYSTEYKGYRIGTWIFNQRQVLKEAKNYERINKFKELGIELEGRERKTFEDRLKDLKDLKEGKIEKTKAISDYIYKIKNSYRKGKLPEEKYEKLKNYVDFI